MGKIEIYPPAREKPERYKLQTSPENGYLVTDGEKKGLKAGIRDEMKKLKGDIETYREAVKPIDISSSIGRITRMDAISSKSINEASLRQARARLAGLEKALKLIDTPGFGTCTGCGGAIPVRRLEIMPESELCMGCMGVKK